jgi:chromosome segregation ATPase
MSDKLDAEKETLQNEIDMLRAQRDRLEEQVSDMHQKYELEKDSHAAAKDALAAQTEESARLQQHVESVEKHRAAALEECNRAQQLHAAEADDHGALKSDLALLESEHAALKAVCDAEKSATQLLNAGIAELEARLSESEELRKSESCEVSELEEVIDSLEADNSELQAKLARLQSELEKARQEADEKQQEIARLAHHGDMLDAALTASKNDNSSFQHENDSLRDEVDLLRQELQLMTANRDSAERAFSDLQHHYELLEKDLLASKELSATLESAMKSEKLEAQRALSQQANKYVTLETEYDSLKALQN